MYRMKVTAILPDELIADVQRHTGGKTITESLNIALSSWVRTQNIMELDRRVKEWPLEFAEDFDAQKIRELNRRS